MRSRKIPIDGAFAGAVLAATLATSVHASTNLITNGGFEAPVISTISGPYGDGSSYVYPFATVGGWTYAGDTGLINGVTGTPWFGNSPPSGFEGAQYAFVQGGSTSVLSQTFTSGAGDFKIAWLEGSRPEFASFDGAQTYLIEVGGKVLGAFSTQSGQNFEAESLTTVLSAGSHTLSFVGDSAAGDHTSFLDDVSVSAVPEPATWATMLLGLIGLAATMRNQRRKQAYPAV